MSDSGFIELLPQLKSFYMSHGGRTDSHLHGQHASTRKGFEDDLFEFRQYIPGDDLRYIDWKKKAASGRLLIREGIQRSKIKIILWLDTSGSMKLYPRKMRLSWLLLHSLAYILRRNHDTIRIYTPGPGEPGFFTVKNSEDLLISDRNYSGWMQMPAEQGDPAAESARLNNDLNSQSLVIYLTDLYTPYADFRFIVENIRSRGAAFSIIHPVQNEEWQRPVKKRFFRKFRDSETGDWVSESEMPDTASLWEAGTEARIRLLKKHRCGYIQVDSRKDVLELLHSLRVI